MKTDQFDDNGVIEKEEVFQSKQYLKEQKQANISRSTSVGLLLCRFEPLQKKRQNTCLQS